MKALVIAHAHPDFSVGGGEIAAFNLFEALKRRSDVRDATFLARTDQTTIGYGAITMRRSGEYLWRQEIGDWFRLRASNPWATRTVFREFLLAVAPDVVFVQHYSDMGIEILAEIRDTLPACRLVLTLHEYMAICHRNGQMVKTDGRLCYRETIDDCHACFPHRSPEDFWLRKHFIQRHFEAADAFVSPSEFLRRRYIEWGLPEEHTFVIENGQPGAVEGDDGLARPAHNRFGFFGQITEFKGADLLLKALHLIPQPIRAGMMVEIHGAKLDGQGAWLRETIETLRKPLISEGVLRWVGSYERSELPGRMAKVGWVVVPSIWWENSPMVIQEAFVNRRPVIAAGIGGMAEKVRNGIDGLHFEARNPVDLAEVLTEAARDPARWRKFVGAIRPPPTYDECADRYVKLVA